MSHAVSLPFSSVADRDRELLGALGTPVATALNRFRKTARQCELAALSDRQLQDAGIDPSLAGRGIAAAVSAATLRRLQSLSWG